MAWKGWVAHEHGRVIEKEEETWGCDGFISLKFKLRFHHAAFPLFRQKMVSDISEKRLQL